MSRPHLALAAALALAPAAGAQVQVGDRPEVLDPKPLTKDELKRQEADLLLRHARTLFGLGVIRHRHDQLIEAVSTLEKAAGLDPASLEIRRALVPLYLAIGREDAAMTQCRDILDQDPHDAETAYQYARLLRAEGKAAEAIPVLKTAAAGKDAQERPERLLFMLSDLFDLVDKKGDHAAAADAQEAIIKTIADKREQLLYGNGFTRDDLQATLARAYERLGRARILTKEYAKATAAFRGARDALLKSEDPDARHQSVRIGWNLSQLLAAQDKYADALDVLEAYLEHGPAEVEPYEKMAEWMRKAGRERDILPALRRYAAKEEFHLGLQLLLAGELARDPRTRREAEQAYQALLARHIKADVYRGLFRLYKDEGRMGKALDLLDDAVRKSKPDAAGVKADERESAQERTRAMLGVLKTEPTLVAAMLPEALAELGRDRERAGRTWALLGSLAARAHQLDKAEHFFRQCLTATPPDHEDIVYAGLLEVLERQRKYKEVVTLCRDALGGARPARNTNTVLFEASLAAALSELGQDEEALAHADKAIQLTSEDSKVRQRQHKAAILAQAGRYDEAVRECQDTMKEFPQAARVKSVRYTLSNVYSLKGDHAKSEEQLRMILEDDPDSALANNNLGYQLAERNVNLEEAERLIRRALEADKGARKEVGEEGENAAYLDSLGWVLFRQGKADEARDWLEKAAALPDGADDPTVWDHLGDVYAKLGQAGKAREVWAKSLKLYDAGVRRKSDGKRAEVAKKLK